MGEKDGRERQSNNGENHCQTYAIAAVCIRHSHSIVQRFKGLYQSRGGHDGDQAMVQRSRAQIGIRHGWSARKVQVAVATVATWPGVDGRSAVAVVVRNNPRDDPNVNAYMKWADRPASRNAVDIGRPHCHVRRKSIDSQVRRVCAELVPETADRRRWRLAPLAHPVDGSCLDRNASRCGAARPLHARPDVGVHHRLAIRRREAAQKPGQVGPTR
ncbi:hypothetical protein GGR16_000748 [Chelatococcus caeni]|uniref:Uncharacterized protein n=1 Tax=Chelatococcus caeni TaxID=1348468 RepID=A0A840BVL3_9HYPH|nr:hypothetical protein [Chelatococcus caeni]